MSNLSSAMIGQKMEPDVFHRIGEDVMAPLWHAGRLYWCLLGVSLGLILLGGFLWTRMLEQGLGLLGIGRPGGWGNGEERNDTNRRHEPMRMN